MNRSDSINGLAAALAKAQLAFLPIKKTEGADFETKRGGRVKYNYATLDVVIESIRKALSENELAIMQPTKIVENALYVETVLCHSSGEFVQCEMYVGGLQLTPQELGSALTYARRYSLSALLGIAAEEDDDAVEAEKGQQGATSTSDRSATREKRPTVAKAPDGDTKERWCAEHNTAWIKTAKMRNYAHIIKDERGNNVLDEMDHTTWCNEPNLPTGSQAETAHEVEGEQQSVEAVLAEKVKDGWDRLNYGLDEKAKFMAKYDGNAPDYMTLEQLDDGIKQLRDEINAKKEAEG